MSIAEKRKQKGMTQKDIARKLGITRPAYTNIENRKKNPSLKVAFKLASILGVTLDDLLREEEKPA